MGGGAHEWDTCTYSTLVSFFLVCTLGAYLSEPHLRGGTLRRLNFIRAPQ